MNNDKFSKEASAIALHCQKALRGRNSRYDANNKRWERANIAAYRIQVFTMLLVLHVLLFILTE
jgi:hypothetical protein